MKTREQRIIELARKAATLGNINLIVAVNNLIDRDNAYQMEVNNKTGLLARSAQELTNKMTFIGGPKNA